MQNYPFIGKSVNIVFIEQNEGRSRMLSKKNEKSNNNVAHTTSISYVCAMTLKKTNKNKLEMSPQMCPLMRVLAVSRKLNKIFGKHFNKLNVTQSQVSILLMVNRAKEVSQNEIGKRLVLERSTVSRDLVRLIDNGYLQKTSGGVSPVVSLTKEGAKLAKLVVREWEKGFNDAYDVLGEKGMNAVAELEQSMTT